MKQEDKELLRKDLCARSPYGVKIHLESPEYGELIGTLDAVYPTDDRVIVDDLSKAIAYHNVRCGGFNLGENNIKPYLRPMSSMTEEEEEEWWEFKDENTIVESHSYSIDWLNAHHFDYRGLIEKGLALEAPEDMYK